MVLDLGPPASTSEDAAQWTAAVGIARTGPAPVHQRDQRIDAGDQRDDAGRQRTVEVVATSVVLPAGRRRAVLPSVSPSQPACPTRSNRGVRSRGATGLQSRARALPPTLWHYHASASRCSSLTGRGTVHHREPRKRGWHPLALPVATVMPGYKAADEFAECCRRSRSQRAVAATGQLCRAPSAGAHRRRIS